MTAHPEATAGSGGTERARVARRAARVATIVIVAALAAYLVGMNLFLRTRLFRNAITSASGSLLVEYRSAYSLFPGRIHVEGLTIRGRDGSVEWILLLDRCDFRVSFAALARRRFHASHVNGDGLSLRVRLRKEATVSPEETAALPPVPGFLDPPLKDVGPPPPPLTDANYNLWSIQLDDVDANHVRELWIDTVRYAGDLEIRGRWLFRPLRWLDVGPATIRLRALDCGYGTIEPWLTGANGELVATVHPFALQEVDGAAILDQVSIDGTVRGTLRTANILGRVLDAPDRDGSGPVRADDAGIDARLRLEHGVWRSGTLIQLDRLSMAARSGAGTFDAALTTEVRVDDGGTGHLTVAATDFRATKGTSETVARAVDVSLASRDLDLGLVGSRFELTGSVEAQGFLGRVEGTTLTAPRLSLAATAARFQPGDEPFAGALMISADALSVGRKEVTGTTDLLVRMAVSRHRSPTDRIDLSGSEVRLRNTRASIKGAVLTVPSLEVRARSLALVESGPVGVIAIAAPDIEVPLALVPNAVLLLPQGVSIDGGHGHATVSADVDLGRRAATGTAHFVAQEVHARVAGEALDGELRLDLHAIEQGGATDLSGSTVAFDGAVGSPPAPWWARGALRDALLDGRRGLRFHAHLVAESKDASPLAAIVANNTAIPRWVLNAISTSGLAATGDLLVSPSTFQARDVRARAAGIDLGFELAELGAEREWALLLDVGVVCAGIDVAGDQTDVLLFGAKPWFTKKTASLRAVERRYE
ncbi:MAG TPA: hypothetical protein VK762_06200 [Polyangiaceae bacterium]|nr:hypothetical protein [Polyangiaceae bacterium]